MPLRIKCPNGHTLIVPDDRAGRTLQCPRCNQPVVVPGGEADAASQALLSVLAEGIPAATLAAGSLRVNAVQSRPAARVPAAKASAVATRPLVEGPPRERCQPSRQPTPSPPSPSSPVVKPKSRVLPAQVPVPAPIVEPVPEPAPTSEPLAEPASGLVPPMPLQPQPVLEQPPPLAFESLANDPRGLVSALTDAGLVDGELIAATSNAAPDSSRIAVEHDETREHHEPQAPPPVGHDEPAGPPLMPPPFVPAPVIAANLAADAARTLAAYQLAGALAAAALFGVVPAVWDVVEFLRTADSLFVARWALLVFFLGVVQLAYAVYLFQLPDWTSVWVVTLFSLALAAVYAAVLGLVLLSPPDGFLVGNSGLQLADKLAGGKAALWCLCMISLSTILAFFAGRLGASWHRAEMMLRIAGA